MKILMPSFLNLSVKASNSAVEGSNHDAVDDTRMLINIVAMNIILKILFCQMIPNGPDIGHKEYVGPRVSTEANVREYTGYRLVRGTWDWNKSTL